MKICRRIQDRYSKILADVAPGFRQKWREVHIRGKGYMFPRLVMFSPDKTTKKYHRIRVQCKRLRDTNFSKSFTLGERDSVNQVLEDAVRYLADRLSEIKPDQILIQENQRNPRRNKYEMLDEYDPIDDKADLKILTIELQENEYVVINPHGCAEYRFPVKAYGTRKMARHFAYRKAMHHEASALLSKAYRGLPKSEITHPRLILTLNNKTVSAVSLVTYRPDVALNRLIQKREELAGVSGKKLTKKDMLLFPDGH